MEQKIETAIDSGLARIAPGLYVFSIGLGIALILLGTVLLWKNKGAQRAKHRATKGLICLAVGSVAIISGALQI